MEGYVKEQVAQRNPTTNVVPIFQYFVLYVYFQRRTGMSTLLSVQQRNCFVVFFYEKTHAGFRVSRPITKTCPTFSELLVFLSR
jgi:hypothetical protein